MLQIIRPWLMQKKVSLLLLFLPEAHQLPSTMKVDILEKVNTPPGLVIRRLLGITQIKMGPAAS
ncbi:hypothetical protein ASD05_14965 [Variovorax sp. Root434]|nr:hypothetical protein ASD05_14965 [Variovorax sp. Root434]